MLVIDHNLRDTFIQMYIENLHSTTTLEWQKQPFTDVLQNKCSQIVFLIKKKR